VAGPIEQFQAWERDQPVRFSIHDDHFEISIEEGEDSISIRVPFDEVGRVAVDDVLGSRVLLIEDNDGVLIAALRMDDPDVARAEQVIQGLRGRT
jgi:hypothetical protein